VITAPALTLTLVVMAAISHAESKTWWDSNFTPKNSKWLQGNVLGQWKKVPVFIACCMSGKYLVRIF
jgi:hypothetical protein